MEFGRKAVGFEAASLLATCSICTGSCSKGCYGGCSGGCKGSCAGTCKNTSAGK